jgi:hypothetical protein
LYLSDDSPALFTIDEIGIHEIPLNPKDRRPAPVSSPNLSYLTHKDSLTEGLSEEFLAYVEKYRLPDEMTPVAIGYLDDHRIGLHAQLHLPADDSFNILLARHDESWKLTGKRHCQRWEQDCSFDELPGHTVGFWPYETLNLWHQTVKDNRYLVETGSKNANNQFRQAGQVTHFFAIDQNKVVLSFTTSPSEHASMDHTFSVRLQIGEVVDKNLCEGQCSANLVDRYLLVQQFWGGTLEVIDLGTGSSVFGPLRHAIWIASSFD